MSRDNQKRKEWIAECVKFLVAGFHGVSIRHEVQEKDVLESASNLANELEKQGLAPWCGKDETSAS